MGHAVNEIDDLWLQISRTRVSEGDEIRQLDRAGLAVDHHPDWRTLAQEVPVERQNTEGHKNIVTLFSYTVSLTAMKFGIAGHLLFW